ncbi:alpha-ketoglutarate dehydrogenase [Burkholderia sp. Ac-20353]|uniref:alpha-ketoglutarate dehydrogenase n=1 Tax=Burkholderia sp. Ac-20353 TaxID=2703894 RepID=UPI00197C4CD3|nr:alpha-ketoglutarate dehydrogenase [Burkholderia sp. Ac-20353]MBN3788371.1 alpha-ketoglutarate dehydrogenase [Burkholderia sp. Ac-20353]
MKANIDAGTGHEHSGGAPVDEDVQETKEWLDALEGVLRTAGPDRAHFILENLDRHAKNLKIRKSRHPYSAYQNTISVDEQPRYPGDLVIEQKLTSIIRWNALAMVVRANKSYGELGGHIASYASAAELFEVGFNHFFRADTESEKGDLVYFQPHSAPGVYARAYLEGRLSEGELSNYRQEVGKNGLCSYPHPWLMPNFWQFPTGSMGIGPISAIYQARFLRYLEHRGLARTASRHVWGVFGDGEMDEPESIAALSLATRERLDNLTFVINCNLQRLDGPVRGNGQVINELEALFSGAGWNVIKVVWGSEWDALFARDKNHALLRRFSTMVDGEYQTLGAKNGEYNLAHFFDTDPELKALVSGLTTAEIDGLRRGGHDFKKLYAAFHAAANHKGAPTVVLAKTKKGFGMGAAGESRMTAHQQKKLDVDALRAFRDRFSLPLDDASVEEMRFYKPDESSPEMQYLRSQRASLGGYLPRRVGQAEKLAVPRLEDYGQFALQGDERESSTTTGLVRLFTNLIKDKTVGPRVVPIVADEARTFGMANLFRQIGIYSPVGQKYEPEDAGSMLFYKEAVDGQLLEEGITEAGAIASWTAAATSYSVNGVAMLPFYIYYSMFGFQRVGDLIWAAADQRARGFLIGATSGRTTLAGEGLQHQDGTSHLIASTVPNCRAYDPAFVSEAAVIVHNGTKRMLEDQEDEFYYITVGNENYPQAALAEDKHDAVVKGMYLFDEVEAESGSTRVRLLGSGAILREVIAAGELLARDWGITAEIWSVTSFSELAKDARECERRRIFGGDATAESHLERCLPGEIPVVAATDYVRAYPQLIASYVRAPFSVLGTDGFGRSDTRAELRGFFEIDRHHIVAAAVHAVAPEKHAEVLSQYGIKAGANAPWMI